MVKHYQSFLTAAAALTPRLNADMVSKAAVVVLGVDRHVAKSFGKSMETAFGWVKSKQRGVSSGTKLTAPVRRVLDAFASASPSPEPARALSSSASSASLSLPVSSEQPAPQSHDAIMAAYGLRAAPCDITSAVAVEQVESSQEVEVEDSQAIC